MVALFAITALYYCLSNLFQIGFVIISYQAMRHLRDELQEHEEFLKNNSHCPTITFIVPAFNEAPVITEAIQALTQVKYSKFEILIINDGSHDETQNVLLSDFQFQPANIPRRSLLSNSKIIAEWESKSDSRIKLIHQENAGKSMALNTGIDRATGELIVTMDADTILEEDALIHIIPYFMRDSGLIGASGIVRILNGTRVQNHRTGIGHLPVHPLALFQVIEYIRAFYLGRLSWDRLDATLLLSGAFTVFRREPIVAVGGFSPTSITEDFEIVIRLRKWLTANRIKGSFRLIPNPVCWTQAPQSLAHLQKQRWRWQSGLLTTLFEHRRFFLARGSGVAGWLAMPYLLLFEAFSPVVDLITIVLMLAHMASQKHQGSHLKGILIIGFIGLVISWLFNIIAIHWTETRFRRHQIKRPFHIWILNMIQFASASFFEMLLFHPLVSWWKLQAIIRHPFVKTQWGQKPRTAISQAASDDKNKSA